MAAKRPPTTVETTPSGIEIAFWDSLDAKGEPQQRRYAIDGERYTNVTTAIGILDKSDALIPWALRLAEEGLDWREVRNEAGTRGTSAHELTVGMIAGERVSLADVADEHRPFAQAGARWKRHRSPDLKIAETMVVLPSVKVAGRLDLLATLDGLPGLGLIDFKTVTAWKHDKKDELYPPYPENLLQLDLYAQGLEESGYPTPGYGMVVRLGPDGEFDETVVDLQPDRGLAIVRAYRCLGAARTELRQARKREAVAA